MSKKSNAYIPSPEVKNKISKAQNRCISCKKCMAQCPMLTNYCDTPKELLKEVEHPDYFMGSEKAVQMPFTCTLCGYCKEVCPKDIDLGACFYALKVDIVVSIGYPGYLGRIPLTMHQTLSFSKAFTTRLGPKMTVKNKRGKDIKDGTGSEMYIESKTSIKTKDHTDSTRPVLFFPGCSPSAHNPSLIKAVYAYLNDNFKTTFYSNCCGNPTYSVGDAKQFEKRTSSLRDDIASIQPKEIVVVCMNCYNTLLRQFPDIPVRTIWEVIDELGLPTAYKASNMPTFALHDPCPTRAHSIIHGAVRRVLDKMEVSYAEYENNRENTVCCGSGAMLSLVHPELAQAHKKKRALDAPESHILTYCQECTESLKLEGRATMHILDLLFADAGRPNGHFDQTTKTTLQKWRNRRSLKLWSDKL